jgi:hypothetical protein
MKKYGAMTLRVSALFAFSLAAIACSGDDNGETGASGSTGSGGRGGSLDASREATAMGGSSPGAGGSATGGAGNGGGASDGGPGAGDATGGPGADAPAVCPASAVDNDPCVGNMTCTYATEVCNCRGAGGGADAGRTFNCNALPSDAANPNACPAQLPANGGSCTRTNNGACNYGGGIACRCQAIAGADAGRQWNCTGGPGDASNVEAGGNIDSAAGDGSTNADSTVSADDGGSIDGTDNVDGGGDDADDSGDAGPATEVDGGGGDGDLASETGDG